MGQGDSSAPGDVAKRDDSGARAARIGKPLGRIGRLEATVRLAGSVAHDMNNILGAIMAVASLLHEDAPDDDPQKPDFAEILEASERGRVLLHKLLERVREHNLQKHRVRVEQLASQVTGLLRRVLPADITLEVDIAEGIPEINGDTTQLGHALMSLCNNSIEAMADGGGTLSIVAQLVPGTGNEPNAAGRRLPNVRITVRDTGPGMDEQTLRRAFEPYFSTRKSGARGKTRGLGLATVHKIVTGHAGQVTLHSTPGEGTEVVLELPTIGGPVTR